jgi:membrane-associated phospholipid phosphatase
VHLRFVTRGRLVAPVMLLVLSMQLGAACFVAADAASAQSTSAYRLDVYRESGLLISGAGLLFGGLAVQSNQQPLTQAEIDALDRNQVNWLDRSATEQWSTGADLASDVLLVTSVASPLVLAIAEARGGEGVRVGIMYAESVLLNNGIVQLLKGVTDRTRPFAYNDDPGIPEEKKMEKTTRRSFPSGHTGNAFAAAVFLASTYSRLHPESPARKWVWAGSLTAATATGYLRYEAGKHFPTDIIAGAVVGASLGYLVPKLHETGNVYVTPSSGGVTLGVVIGFH